MRDKLGDRQRLIHISESAASIQEFLKATTKEEFLKKEINFQKQIA